MTESRVLRGPRIQISASTLMVMQITSFSNAIDRGTAKALRDCGFDSHEIELDVVVKNHPDSSERCLVELYLTRDRPIHKSAFKSIADIMQADFAATDARMDNDKLDAIGGPPFVVMGVAE